MQHTNLINQQQKDEFSWQICLQSSSSSFISCSDLSVLVWLSPCELSSTLLAYSIQQSAGRPAGDRVEAVSIEVQHQAFCQPHPGLWVSHTHKAHYKQRCRREKEALWERSVMYAHSNIWSVKNIKQFSPNTRPQPCVSVLLPLPPNAMVQRDVQKTENLQLSPHDQLHSPKIKMLHNGSHLWVCSTIEAYENMKGCLHRGATCVYKCVIGQY